MHKTTSSKSALRGTRIRLKKRVAAIVEPPEEVFREMLLAGFDQAFGIEIDDVFPANQTGGDEVHR